MRRKTSVLFLAACCGGCAALRSKDNTDAAVRAVVSGDFSQTLVQGFAIAQRRLMTDMYQTWPKKTISQSILVVSQVENSPIHLNNFEFNMDKLNSRNTVGDQFYYALFHRDNASIWTSRPWYKDRVVYNYTGYLCPAEAWYQLDPQLVKSFDLVWLLDPVFRMDYFSWDLYRTVLSTVRPAVSQPAIVPFRKGFHVSDKDFLHMRGKDEHGYLPLAREVHETQPYAVLITTRIWDAVHLRLQETQDRKTAWCVPAVWNVAAGIAQKYCKMSGPLVVDASPLRRMENPPVLLAQDEAWFYGKQNQCFGETSACPNLVFGSAKLYRQVMQPWCELPEPMPLAVVEDGVPGLKTSVHQIVDSRMWADRFEDVVEVRPVVEPKKPKPVVHEEAPKHA